MLQLLIGGGSSSQAAATGESSPWVQESQSPDLVNLSFFFLVRNTLDCLDFDQFDPSLFMPDEGKPETSCSNKQYLKVSGAFIPLIIISHYILI